MTVKTAEKIKKKEILRAEIHRTEDGILLYLQSKEIEDLIKKVSRGRKFKGTESYWKDVEVYKIPKSIEITGLRMVNSKAGLLFKKREDYYQTAKLINISYFRLVGLGEGHVLHIPGLFTQEDIKEYLKRLRKRTTEVYEILNKKVQS